MDVAADGETELLRCIAEGDLRRAGSILVARYADDVLAVCRAMVRDPHVAEDLSQDAFGRAFAALSEFRGDASPRTWLLRIARNRCIDHLRRARHEPRGLDDEADDHAADAPLTLDALLSRADLAQALSTLNEGERALVVLRFGHGMDYAELAAVFGLREGTIRMRVSRALAKMRDALEPPLAKSRARSEHAAALEEAAATLDEEAPTPPRGAPRPAPSAPARSPGSPPAPPPRAASFGAPPPQALGAAPSAGAPALRCVVPPALRARLEQLALSIS